MVALIKEVYSKEDACHLYGYDLLNETYLGSRYVVTFGLSLEALSPSEALEKLYGFRGHIFRFKDKKEFLKMFDTKLDGPLNH
ncbi:hypothetical protein [Marinobacter halophilus]|uniref:Uncharacterized protein n=1 Tax=Marinobacter halophilus TaxID=1323740 RepID=A0A2T1K9W5_9GAMM|nr:hypothetical protein [Marinobacter halophilus]PSF06907.1 hypothetical protein C7H08_17700 [Marinobacter halophilus]GGC76504.1 hypothetical protein GCM10011362_26420 [Marinobacter halophilus]